MAAFAWEEGRKEGRQLFAAFPPLFSVINQRRRRHATCAQETRRSSSRKRATSFFGGATAAVQHLPRKRSRIFGQSDRLDVGGLAHIPPHVTCFNWISPFAILSFRSCCLLHLRSDSFVLRCGFDVCTCVWPDVNCSTMLNQVVLKGMWCA